MKNVVLASTSPRRQELLENVGLIFDIVAPNFDENILNKSFSYDLIENIAEKKGESVAKQCNFPAIIISADTVVIFNGRADFYSLMVTGCHGRIKLFLLFCHFFDF